MVGNQIYVETPQLAIASCGYHWPPCKMPNPPYNLGKNVKFGFDCSNALLILFPCLDIRKTQVSVFKPDLQAVFQWETWYMLSLMSWALVWTLGCHFKTNVTRNLLIGLLGPLWYTRGAQLTKWRIWHFLATRGPKVDHCLLFRVVAHFLRLGPWSPEMKTVFNLEHPFKRYCPKRVSNLNLMSWALAWT